MELLTTFIWCVIMSIVIWFGWSTYELAVYWKKRKIPYAFEFPFISGIGSFLIRRQSINDIATNIYMRLPNTRYYGALNAQFPIIVVRDPELIREICIKNFDSFTDHVGFVNSEMDPIFGRNVFSLKGHEWKDMRGTLSPSFTASKMKFMFELVSKCALEFTDFFLRHPEAADCIDMKDAFTRYTNDVIATTAFGISVNSLEDRDNEFYMRGKCASNFTGFSRAVKFILTILAPKVMRFLGFTFMTKDTNTFFMKVISETVKMREEQGIVRPDMIHLLMQAKDKDGVNLKIFDIMAQAFIFFIAGFETTANHMCTVSHELAMNPEIQEKLRREVEEHVSNRSGEIPYESLSRMKYMDMVLKEALRKYPPVSMNDRVCTGSFQFPPSMPGFPEYNSEIGLRINIPIYGLHHDPKYYPNPEKFDPERFSDENKDSIDMGAYLPFGIGPRQCIASRFATMETKILLAYILLNFDIKPTAKTRHPVVFRKTLIMAAEGGFWTKFEERKKVN